MSGSGIWDSLNQAASMGAKMLGQATNDNTGVVIRENDILCSGSLEKCSKFLATWKKRHMVLTKDYLCSFEHEGQLSNPTEVLLFLKITISRSDSILTNLRFKFIKI